MLDRLKIEVDHPGRPLPRELEELLLGQRDVVLRHLIGIRPVAPEFEKQLFIHDEAVRQRKLIARELDVPVIALSQLSRTVESRSPQIPMLSDLRESGSIEQDADIVMFIHREDYYDKETERQNIADLIIAKHRRGATGNVGLYFDKARVRFMSLDTHHDEPNT